jgi:hypothetical protein
MKKSFGLSLVLAAAMLVGATSANAATIKANGNWQVDAMWGDQFDLRKDSQDNSFSIGQRMRTKFEFIANENLKGVLETQIGTQSWGRGMYGIGAGRTPGYSMTGTVDAVNNTSSTNSGSTAANVGNLMFRKGYIDFKWPGTKVNFLVGYQSLALPSAFGTGNAILDDHVAGAAAIVPVTDWLSLVGGYARAIDTNGFGATGNSATRGAGYMDSAFMYANLDFTGYKIQPFLAYSYAGKAAIAAGANVNDGTLMGQVASNTTALGVDAARGYYGGVAFTMTALDPFQVMADFNYGKSTYNGAGRNNGWGSMGRSGYLFDLAVDYTGLSMMTPEVFFAYTSGGNSDKTNDGRMATLSAENWTYGSFFMQTSDALSGTVASQTESDSKRNLGFWAVGLSLKDIKLIDKLSHTVNFVYFKGTNNNNIININNGTWAYGKTLTTKDSIFEFDLNSKYQIYEELSLGLELGYINAAYDKTMWGRALGVDSSDLSKDAYKAAFMLNYSF